MILLTSTTLILPAVFVLHTFIVEQQEAQQKNMEAEIAHLQTELGNPNRKMDGVGQLPGVVHQTGGISTTSHDWLLLEPLSSREMEVLALLAASASNHEIAQQLMIAPNTVKRLVKHILAVGLKTYTVRFP